MSLWLILGAGAALLLAVAALAAAVAVIYGATRSRDTPESHTDPRLARARRVACEPSHVREGKAPRLTSAGGLLLGPLPLQPTPPERRYRPWASACLVVTGWPAAPLGRGG